MIGEALRLIRVFHDIKAKDLSKELGISQSYLSEIENEKKDPSLDLIKNYARFFNTKPSSILFFSEEVDSEKKGGLPEGIHAALRKNILNFLKAIEDANPEKISNHT